MEEKIKKLVIVAGEASGDMHASHLVCALQDINPRIQFYGLGGTRMQDAGVTVWYNLVDLAVVGFVEVLKNIALFKKIFNGLLARIDEIKPDAVILIDYPGFNLRLAKELKKKRIRVIYYISPQVWAWGKNRIRLIKECVDKMIVIFKFEEELYRQHGVDASFVGHPLRDTITITQSREEFLRAAGLSERAATVSLLPGSRAREVKTLLAPMLKAARIMYERDTNIQFLLLQSPALAKNIFDENPALLTLPLRIIKDNTYNGINAADIVISASGTATLEVALLQKPLVIVYKVAFVTWLLAKWLITIPYIGLANVVAGKKLMPELIQFDATAQKIARETLALLADNQRREMIARELKRLKDVLGEPGASKRAAGIIADLL